MITDQSPIAGSDTKREPGSPLHLLIVDDAPSTRLFLRGVLEHSSQFDVVGEAGDGAMAIELADSLQPDVVLLDLSMPVTDGSSALAGLLAVAPRTRVIVLSGTDTPAAPLLAAGATALLPKGLSPFELLDRLDSSLGLPVPLPRTVPQSPTLEQPSADPSPAVPGRTHPRAVICDDDPTTRRLVAQILANCNVPVVAETDTVPHLLSVMGLAQPELLVLDLWLEGTPGTSALPDIGGISPGTYVVVYSAYAELKDRALASGAASFIAKPNFVALEDEIRRVVTGPPR
jgi:DNA-binding NarL/FixJ family response regulator